MGLFMKKHKIQHVIKKQGGHFQVVFRDGGTMFCPRECACGLNVGTTVIEHKHKNGQTVAFSWHNQLRYVVSQPMHFDAAVDFLEKFRWFDRIAFNKAVVQKMGSRDESGLFPDISQYAHNVVLAGIKTSYSTSR